MKGPLNRGGGAYFKWNGPIDFTDNSFDIRPMKIHIMFLVHNFQKFGAGFFNF